jgi:hypothetical protein
MNPSRKTKSFRLLPKMNVCLANLRENFHNAIGLNYLLTVRTNTQMPRLEQQDETRKGGEGKVHSSAKIEAFLSSTFK